MAVLHGSRSMCENLVSRVPHVPPKHPIYSGTAVTAESGLLSVPPVLTHPAQCNPPTAQPCGRNKMVPGPSIHQDPVAAREKSTISPTTTTHHHLHQTRPRIHSQICLRTRERYDALPVPFTPSPFALSRSRPRTNSSVARVSNRNCPAPTIITAPLRRSPTHRDTRFTNTSSLTGWQEPQTWYQGER